LLADVNSVTHVTEFREVDGGSTGRKVMLSVEYDRAATGLHTDLFAKFSRDLDNPVRDRGKTQMEPEVRFASLSRVPGFPIGVPSVQFGDYHRRTGTGILIKERINFGDNGIERQYHKCLDYEMPEPLANYRALLTALASLAGIRTLSGRSTREFFDLLLSERGAGLDWQKADLTELHSACQTARAESDLRGLTAMSANILDDDPAYEF
jgi:hypothetical protein